MKGNLNESISDEEKSPLAHMLGRVNENLERPVSSFMQVDGC